MALAYISVKMCRRFTAHVGPHAKLIVKFLYRQSLNMCKVFYEREMKPPVVLLDPLQSFSSWVFVGFELVFLDSCDHHDLWSHGNWQSGSWVAITLVDRVKEEKTYEISTLHLQFHEGERLKE